MRRFVSLFAVCIVLIGALVFPVRADSAATKMDIRATVTSEGNCLVTTTVMLRLEAAKPNLMFPLPLDAKGITMNGANVSSSKVGSATLVDIGRITGNSVGEYSLMFEYTIPEAVKVTKINEDYKLQLTLPLLCGFEYPVEKLNFVITMPDKLTKEDPTFNSIYRQASIASDLDCLVDGNQIIGSSKVVLNDHDGITMTMVVEEKMFPTVSTYVREGNPELVPMLVFAGLALLYWLLFLRTKPLIRQRSSTAPEGITAGELGCRLTLSGGDLTMMVFSWAQLGYILIHMDGNGRIMLHKRMDMGNERNQFENKVFRMLFGNRRSVDATGMTYARLCRKVQRIIPSERNMYKGSSGNMRIFRALACVSQMICGVCVAMNFEMAMAFQIILAVILAVFGMVTGWLIQDIAYRTHLRGKTAVYIGFACMLIWIVLGLLCGQVWIPLGCVFGEFLMGYLAAYGGRRSDLGRHDAAQVLGLRTYLKHLQSGDISRLLNNDPDFFFNMAPHALAMGIINPYAKAFGRRMLPQCPYIVSRISGKRTAEEWGHLMADVADLMDLRARQLQVEKWITPPNIRIDLTPIKKQTPKKKPAQSERKPAEKKPAKQQPKQSATQPPKQQKSGPKKS